MIKKSATIFSFANEQRSFTTLLVGLLSFLCVLSLGLVIALSTAVNRWNNTWSLMATAQIMPGANAAANIQSVERILQNNIVQIVSVTEISEMDAKNLLRPWLASGDALTQFIPRMFEITFQNTQSVRAIGDQIASIDGALFIRHNDSMRGTTVIGWRMIGLGVLVLALVLGAVIISISYITRNITLIHKRELEILNQVGASDDFIARQLMTVIGHITIIASMSGFLAAVPVLLIISGIANTMKTGMFTQMAIPFIGWVLLITLVAGIVALSVWTAKKTVIRILNR